MTNLKTKNSVNLLEEEFVSFETVQLFWMMFT